MSNTRNATPTGQWRKPNQNVGSVNEMLPPPAPMNIDYSEISLDVPSFTVDVPESGAEAINGTSNKDSSIHGVAGGKINKRKKKTLGQKSLRLKRHVLPKNAVICLNELRPGIIYNVENNESGLMGYTTVSVEIDEIKFYGSGPSKQFAKQEAAEAALSSFVKSPAVKSTGTEQLEDETPWSVLARFAMFKLFNKWMDEGRVNMNNEGDLGMPVDNKFFQQTNYQQPSSMVNTNMMMHQQVRQSSDSKNSILSEYLGIMSKDVGQTTHKPPKKGVPENATSMHPMMLLHQMRPTYKLIQTKFTNEADKAQMFRVSTVLEEHTFVGEGRNVKTAKYNMAVQANKVLFEIDCNYATPM